VAVTLISSVCFFLSPRQYQAEGFLQIIPPIASFDEKVDRDLFETIIISHLQMIQSAFIAKKVSAAISAKNVKLDPMELEQQMKIARPPKSNLIAVTATFSSPDTAVNIVSLWIQNYLASVRKSNINVALSQVRNMLKKAQSVLMEVQAKTEQLKMHADKMTPLVELDRGVDNNQLWRDIPTMPSIKLKPFSSSH